MPEVTFGVTPANPVWKGLRHNGLNFGLTKDLILSKEIRADRQQKCGHHGNQTGGGEVSAELAPLDFDDLMEAVMCGTWAAYVAPYTASTISAAAADNSINDSANLMPLVLPGMKVTISGFTGTVGNNQSGIVVSRTASKIILTTTTPLVNDAAGEAVTITTNTLAVKPGTTRRSFSVLRQFGDIAEAGEPFHLIPGVEFNNMAVNFTLGENVGVSFASLSRDYIPSGTAPAGSTFTAAGSICPFNSLSGTIKEGGEAIAILSEVSFTLENGMTPRFGLMSDKMKQASVGKSLLTGSITAYFETSALLKKFLDETVSSLELVVEQGGWRYHFNIPSIKYTGGQPDVAEVADVVLTLPFQAFLDSTTGTNIAIAKTEIA